MATTTSVTIVGNLVRDPEIRYTKAGKPVVSLTIASTPRSYDQTAKEWKDGEPVFLRGSAWDEMAENIAASLSKGSRVVAIGVMKASTYKDREGNERTSNELQIDEMGPTLKFHTAIPEKRGKASPIAKGPTEVQSQDNWVDVDDDDTPF